MYMESGMRMCFVTAKCACSHPLGLITLRAQNNHTHTHTHAGGDMTPAPDNCFEMPTMPACANYKYPMMRAIEDLNMLCTSMPDMPGCSLRDACQVWRWTEGM